MAIMYNTDYGVMLDAKITPEGKKKVNLAEPAKKSLPSNVISVSPIPAITESNDLNRKLHEEKGFTIL